MIYSIFLVFTAILGKNRHSLALEFFCRIVMLSDQRVLDVKTSRVPEKTSQLTDWSFWDHSRLPLAGANASLEIQARLFQKWILITTILHPPHFANSSLCPPRFKLLTPSLRVKVVTSQFIRRKSFFLGFIQADIGNLVNYSLSFNNLSLNNNFGLTWVSLVESRVEIPLKNRSRFERFERFSSKIWAVWAVWAVFWKNRSNRSNLA